MRSPEVASIPIEDLAANARGLALAAFGSIETIRQLRKCTVHEAEAFQADAVVHWNRLMVAALQAKHSRGITS
jgi:hypothetical protein